MPRQQELFERLRDVGFRTQALKGIVQNEVPSYPQEEIDDWEYRIQECIDELFHLKADVGMFLIRESLKQ